MLPVPPMFRAGSDIRLATRIALVASALTVLFALIVGGTSYWMTRSQITQGTESALDNNASLIAGRLSSTLGSVVNTLSELKQNDLIINSLMDSLTRTTSLEPFLADFSTVNGVPVEIVLTDFEGNAVAGSRSVTDTTSRWNKPVLESGTPFVSIENRSSGVYMIVAEPVFYSRTRSTEGALIHKIDLTGLIRDINVTGGHGLVRILQHGEPILLGNAAPDHDQELSSMFTKVRQLDLPDVLARLGLSVEVSASEAAVNQPLKRLTLIYLGFGLVLVVVVIFLSIFAANRLARPLSELEQVAAMVVASGSFDHRFEGGGYTEIIRLGQTFNHMLDSLGSAHAQVTKLANQDVLTGLANRALFHKNLCRDLLSIQRSHEFLAILLLDIDKFKDINDTLGHPVGDELLKQITIRLQALVRTTDTVSRLGGDEFALIAMHLNDNNDAAILGQKIINSLAEPYLISDQEIHISVSIGIAICPGDGDDPNLLLSNADLALYKAKENGRGNFQFFNAGLNATAQQRKQVEKSIRTALDHSQYCLHYQPKIDLKTGAIVGVEALVRWQSENGLVYPDHFIPIAEDSRLIVPLGEWILGEACRQKLAWEQSGLPPFSVAVNLSVVQLGQEKHITRLMQVIEDSGVDPEGLEIEITESALLEKTDAIPKRLRSFRDLGVSLAIDDIGTGYSSLSNLKRLPVDVLKIDRSFIRGLEVDNDDAAITKAIIQLGLSLDLTIVAEGVETSGQVKFLQQQGCHQSQGFLYSPALNERELVKWVEGWDSSDDPVDTSATQVSSSIGAVPR